MTCNHSLSDRQQREIAFYEQYASHQEVEYLDLAPVMGLESRPWNPYWAVYERAVQHYQPRTGQRLLEFGCGVGIAAVRLAVVGYEVFGFDISPVNIRMARQLAARHGVADRCHFQIMAAENLEYSNHFFDVITGIDILHHVEIPQAISEAARVLKPGGIALFKEHIQVPVIDAIRQTALVRAIAPTKTSLDHHITDDERKLTKADLQTIGNAFDRMQVCRFTLVSRLDRLLSPSHDRARRWLQKLDYHLLKRCPQLSRFGGTVMMICEQNQAVVRQAA